MDIAMVWVPPWRPWRRTSMVYGSLWYFWKMVFRMYAFAEVFGGQHDRASPEKRKHVCLLRVLRMPEKAQSETPYHASDRAGNPLVHMLFHNWILSHKWGYPVNQWLIQWKNPRILAGTHTQWINRCLLHFSPSPAAPERTAGAVTGHLEPNRRGIGQMKCPRDQKISALQDVFKLNGCRCVPLWSCMCICIYNCI